MKGLYYENIKSKVINRKKAEKSSFESIMEKYYVSFGKYIINTKQLNNNILLIKSIKSLGAVNKLRRTPITDEFKNLIIDLLDTGKLNIQTQKKLTQTEIVLLEHLLNISGLTEVLNYSRREKDTNDYLDRLILIQGTLEAGNDNTDIKKEAIDIIKLLSNPNINKISIIDAEMLINSLS
jgi:hypothetical protein